ncbi:MAG: NUDIX domain-containing protein [Minisyncoccia bacterium]
MDRHFSAGGVVFKKQDNQVLWLVTKASNHNKDLWRLPKGWLDDKNGGPGELGRGIKKASETDLQQAALREVKEEGGVNAKIITKIKTIKYFSKWQGKTILKFVTFYLMEYINDVPQGFGFETEEIRWLNLNQAKALLNSLQEKEILLQANKIYTNYYNWN